MFEMETTLKKRTKYYVS